ncbi:uncharacterized protein UV8b_06227 [Ustilaginoidea virens]|uniref:SEC63 domain-containing protein n=1 Tax=Ustilaginoidea virens TaxID=1159556 RepID=A0A063BX94_USTVR|nr:uncharacterized protein UV8b_06227 [Ustilaginoidea virens]QUC21986.1 hypothetical protein UV8b_06227 [Ustilaginoidea virens]GAO19436.1 hypothetical protein UVI_02023340 [Ustilaginoidea virens]
MSINESDLRTIQLRYKLSPATMKVLGSLPTGPSRQQVLHKSCLASEFRSFPLKLAEKDFFREINDHTAIPYTVKEAITQPWHKIYLLVQADLLRTPWPNKISVNARKELYQERKRIYGLLDRVLRCLADAVALRGDGKGVNVCLDVLRSVNSGVWEGEGKELLLVEGIGQAKAERLRKAGITTIKQLGQLDFCHIERLLSRNPPFGHRMLEQLAGFPRLACQFQVFESPTLLPGPGARTSAEACGGKKLWVCRVVLSYDNEQLPHWKKGNPWVTLVIQGGDGRLLWFWRGHVKKLSGAKDLVVGMECRSKERIDMRVACEDIVGTAVDTSHQMS